MSFEELLALLAIVLPPTFGYVYTKKQMLEADRNRIKQEYYRKYIETLSLITDGEINHANKVVHAKASNDLYIIASREVIYALQIYQDAQSNRMPNEVINFKMSELVKAMRKDLKIKTTADWAVKLWTAGRPKD